MTTKEIESFAVKKPFQELENLMGEYSNGYEEVLLVMRQFQDLEVFNALLQWQLMTMSFSNMYQDST